MDENAPEGDDAALTVVADAEQIAREAIKVADLGLLMAEARLAVALGRVSQAYDRAAEAYGELATMLAAEPAAAARYSGYAHESLRRSAEERRRAADLEGS